MLFFSKKNIKSFYILTSLFFFSKEKIRVGKLRRKKKEGEEEEEDEGVKRSFLFFN